MELLTTYYFVQMQTLAHFGSRPRKQSTLRSTSKRMESEFDCRRGGEALAEDRWAIPLDGENFEDLTRKLKQISTTDSRREKQDQFGDGEGESETKTEGKARARRYLMLRFATRFIEIDYWGVQGRSNASKGWFIAMCLDSKCSKATIDCFPATVNTR